MAHPALKRYSHFGQFGILIGFTGAGFVLAGIVSLIPMLTTMKLSDMASQEQLMKKLLVPENANMLRIIQLLSTLVLFFFPAFFYAKLCHKKAFEHLGYTKKVNVKQAAAVLMIMLAALPLVAALGELTKMLPFSKSTFAYFQQKEDEYAAQVEIIGRMKNFGEYFVSLFMLAILPALFEETIFRGGLQNLLSRWTKLPILAIVITSLLFSAVHFSFLGFLSRAFLGFVLGWIYYRTGNLWLSIIGHMVNNGVAITVLYIMKLKNPNLDMNKADPEFPIWMGLVSAGIIYALFVFFERVSKYQIDRPGQEVAMQVEDNSNPSWTQQTNNNLYN